MDGQYQGGIDIADLELGRGPPPRRQRLLAVALPQQEEGPVHVGSRPSGAVARPVECLIRTVEGRGGAVVLPEPDLGHRHGRVRLADLVLGAQFPLDGQGLTGLRDGRLGAGEHQQLGTVGPDVRQTVRVLGAPVLRLGLVEQRLRRIEGEEEAMTEVQQPFDVRTEHGFVRPAHPVHGLGEVEGRGEIALPHPDVGQAEPRREPHRTGLLLPHLLEDAGGRAAFPRDPAGIGRREGEPRRHRAAGPPGHLRGQVDHRPGIAP
ncbi:hypothetical protein [Streptomyces sp. MOE7]|uniref:hypothetical protein n=1 Tax=Streptomyces sp. MOE7 TaxID=1961713 RepID=UPI003FA79144